MQRDRESDRQTVESVEGHTPPARDQGAVRWDAWRASLRPAVAFLTREWWIAGVWAGQRVFLLILTWLVQRFEHPYYLVGTVSWQSLLVPWTSWDAGAFQDIALHGYSRLGAVGYSPFYPFLIWLTGFIPGSGLVIASVAELAALYLLFDLICKPYGAATARRVVLFLAWTPFAVYFSAAYSESVFLLCSVGVFWALQRNRLLLAGVLAAAGALTRQYGILLCLPLLGAFAWRRALALALPVAALGAYWTWASWRFHVFFAPLAVEQDVYVRHLTWPWWGIVNTAALIDGPHTFFLAQHSIVDLALVFLALVLAVALVRIPGRWREALYGWASILVILCLPIHTGPSPAIDALASAPRYLALLFPLVLPLALWARTRARERVVMWSSLLGVAYLSTLFVAGIWIG